MSTVKIARSNSASRSLAYAEKRATERSAYNCDSENIKDTQAEMQNVREIFDKTDKTQAHTVIQTFSPEESRHLTPQQVNQMGYELAEKIAPGHQVAIYTHTDKAHLHNHLVINAVNFENGKKYHHNNDFARIKACNDEIAKNHNLEIIKPKKQFEKRTSAEIQMQKRNIPSWKDEIRKQVDKVMQNRSVSSYNQFKELLKENGINVKDRGKNVTYELLDTNYRVRGSKLGSSYERNTIKSALDSRQVSQSKATVKKLPQLSNRNRLATRQDELRKKTIKNLHDKKLNGKLGLDSSIKFNKFKSPMPIQNITPINFTIPVKIITKIIEKTIKLNI